MRGGASCSFEKKSIFAENYLRMKKFTLILCAVLCTGAAQAQHRSVTLLDKGWKFAKGDYPQAAQKSFDDSRWQRVEVPHDWAIYGPFDVNNDLQTVMVVQNGEKTATRKTGRTGGLPYVGAGWYRTTFSVPQADEKRRASLLFDGAMSEAEVYVNGKKVGFWPYGYNAFHFDVTEFLSADGKDNLLAVRLENRPQSSRWYPGAGLYRNVRLVVTGEVHVPIWGTYITTPFVSREYASVKLKVALQNAPTGKDVEIFTSIYDAAGSAVASKRDVRRIAHEGEVEQNFIVNAPQLWSPETPALYRAVSKIFVDGKEADEYATRFGIREVRFVADKGFFLNGEKRKFKGVCNHHDLGPLGAAVSTAALRRQLALLKDMGCDAVRTAHNMPAPELVQLCDEVGFMMIVENFDEWDKAKCENGYHRFFSEWAERDMVNMLRGFRNNPSVVLWSIGNEVPTQCSKDGYSVARFLQNICHREDAARPVTCGIDRVSCALDNGFAAVLDIPGLNYRTERYHEAYKRLPQNLILGSETASTVSSRGVYKFPVEVKADAVYPDHQSSSYDVEHCSWSNLPDADFALADDNEWTLGQFVWTGFDYLGEPSPYDTDAWPNHSSMFGIIDLASIPKDRYYLYRSVWNTAEPTLHVLPHWSWEGSEGQVVPVFAYTSYPTAELFINGKSQGRQTKSAATLQHRYRLMWTDAKFERGELRVVAYDSAGKPAAEKVVRTAGAPHRVELTPDRTEIAADGKDLAYINVRVVDKDGNLCPNAQHSVKLAVRGAGKFRAVANGNPASLELFHLPQMQVFNGQLTAIVQSGTQSGKLTLEATASGLQGGKAEVGVR